MGPVPIKAVVVEDDHDLRMLYQLKLKHDGFDVHTAEDGQQGLRVIKQVKPDIILLDLLMPIMSGTEMLSRLRAEEWGSSIHVIALTNISKDEAPAALRFLHVDRYIVKAHHTPAEVVAIVREVLGSA